MFACSKCYKTEMCHLGSTSVSVWNLISHITKGTQVKSILQQRAEEGILALEAGSNRRMQKNSLWETSQFDLLKKFYID
jgi:hypothetical protein